MKKSPFFMKLFLINRGVKKTGCREFKEDYLDRKNINRGKNNL